jgi:hypothetical protein
METAFQVRQPAQVFAPPNTNPRFHLIGNFGELNAYIARSDAGNQSRKCVQGVIMSCYAHQPMKTKGDFGRLIEKEIIR